MIDLWAACRDALVMQPLAGEVLRMVESQEQIATNALVDSLEEQALLESLLDANKPPPPAGSTHLHYLLSTPFRYPPLRHGSRFGPRHAPSLFYGARDHRAALAETAYYRCVFWSGMAAAPPSGRLTTGHTLFAARLGAARGLSLQTPPFTAYRDVLTSPTDYGPTQQLGEHMREAGIDAFEYRSARDPAHGLNLALFHPRAFAAPSPVWQEAWMCELRADSVIFYHPAHGTQHYPRTTFLVDGVLPTPAL